MEFFAVEVFRAVHYYFVAIGDFLPDGCSEFVFELFMAVDFETLTQPNTALEPTPTAP